LLCGVALRGKRFQEIFLLVAERIRYFLRGRRYGRMAKPDASLQVSLGNIFVRRLRNPVDGHFGADCESQCFRGLRGAHHFGDSNGVVCQRSGCPVSRTTITLRMRLPPRTA
jgi:hypothetical protein